MHYWPGDRRVSEFAREMYGMGHFEFFVGYLGILGSVLVVMAWSKVGVGASIVC